MTFYCWCHSVHLQDSLPDPSSGTRRLQTRTWCAGPRACLPRPSSRFQELNLSFCEIKRDAALAVAEAVADKAELEKLDLNGEEGQPQPRPAGGGRRPP